VDIQALNLFMKNQKEWVQTLLCDMISIPSTRGGETPVHNLLAQRLSSFVDKCEVIPVDINLPKDPEYSSPDGCLSYEDKTNLRLESKGSGKTIIINTHSDVVPPSEGHVNPYVPYIDAEGVLFGRGACDAKGQIATMALVMKAISQFEKPNANIIFHIASEEESGGNGTLALVRSEREKADLALVLEPSDLKILPSIRGALWFDIGVTGKSGHSGSSGIADSALYRAIRAVEILRSYHAELLEESRGYGLFEGFENPMPLTIGKFTSGKWASTVPDKAHIMGVIGFLPNKTREQVMAEIEAEFKKDENRWVYDNINITYPYRHDGVTTDPNGTLTQELKCSCEKAGFKPDITAMTASCDAVYYKKLLNLPVVVFGPGSLKYAHSSAERINVGDILKAATAIYLFLLGSK
jgi:acetylornithine deacetylase